MLGYFQQLCLCNPPKKSSKAFALKLALIEHEEQADLCIKTSLLLLFPPHHFVNHPSLTFPLCFVLLLKWRWKHCAFPWVSLFLLWSLCRPHGTPVIPLFPLLIGQWNLFSGAGVFEVKARRFWTERWKCYTRAKC